MEKSRKSLLVWFLAAICFVCSIFSCVFLGKKTDKVSASGTSFEMVGASVRTSQMDGIRFVAKMDETEWATLGDVRYGVIILPADLADGSLTVSYADGTYTASDEDAIVIEGGELWSDELKTQYEIDGDCAVFSCALIADQGDGTQAVRFPVEFYNRPLTAVAFIIPESGETLYTQQLTRSMSYVALVESLKSGYESNTFIEDIVKEVEVDFSVAGGSIDNTKNTYVPELKIGGMEALDSSMVSVTYTSSNTAVAKVEDGKVQAVADGQATITATVKVGGTATFTATTTLNVSILKATVTATATTGGSVSGGGAVEKGTSVSLTATAATGYTFDGWYIGGNKVSSSTNYTFTATADVQVEARFAINTYTVTFKNGSTVVSTQTVEHNGSPSAPANPTKTGYTFQGWGTSSGATTTVDLSTQKITAAKTFYAVWKINTYTVSFNVNGGSGTVASQTVNYNSTASVPTTNPTKTGYTFKGWATSSTGTTAFDFATKITGNKTLYAIWQINSYTVSFNVNGGSGTVASQTVNYNSTATAPTTNPTKTGYTFKGWATSSTGTTAFDFATKITGNTTLYAIWQINTYTVSFNVNGGSGTVASQTVNYNAKPTTPSEPTRTGYTFQGWGTSSGATTTVDVTTLAITGNKTYYAVWKINTYTVTFNANSGSGGSTQTVNYNAKPTTPSNPTRTGYTFQGWGTSSSATTAVDVTATAITGNKTYYAIWKINTYTVTFDANSGSGGSTQTVNYNAKPTTPSNPTRTGYTFQGWGTSSSATTTVDVTATAITANKTYYAVWKINTYTIKFSVDGTVSTTKTVNYNATVSAPSNPTKTGYTFKHWSKTDGGSTAYTFSSKVTSSFTLYAVWTVNTYSISVSAATAGGSVSGGGTKNYGSSVTLKATTNSGYTFLGWYDSDDKKVETAASYTFTVKNAVTLKAKWKAGALTEEEKGWRAKQGYNYFYYTQLGTDVMPIGAWCAPPPNTSVTVNGVKKTFSTNQITQANYNTIKESGINAIYGLYDSVWSNDNNSTREGWVKSALNYAQNAGMVYVVRDGNAYTALSDKGTAAWSQMEYYMSHPAYGGTLFVDEPGYEQFDEIGAAMKLWKQNEVYGDNKLPLVNNLPNYSSAPQLYYGIATKETSAPVDYTGANFENWVRAYLELTGAPVYSYDFYPYAGYGNNYMKDPNGYGFFDNISAVRKVCMEKNVPFWTFNQSGSAFGATRQLTQAETAMQVNLSLAYGAKGIQWFNYWQPLESADTDDALCALVDHYGNKTRYYSMVQKVNKQVAAVDSYLMKSKSTGIIEIGKSILGGVPSADKVTKYGALTSASGIGNAIVGCFEYRDKGYVYYVASSDWTEDAVVNLNFNGTYSITTIQNAEEHWYTSNSVTVQVPAGDGVLLYVPKSTTSATTAKITVSNDNSTAGSAFGTGNYKTGSLATVAAQANPGYKFLGWYNGNSIVTAAPVYHFTVGSAMTLKAYWQEDTNAAMLNDCEQNLGWITDYWGNGLTLSTSHVTQGTYSAKSEGVMKIRLGEHPLSLAELKATYKAIRIHIYLDAASTTLMLGNWGKAYKDLTRGSNYVIIKTADLTSDYYFIENGSGILYLSTTAVTSYVDNVVGLKSTVMLNDCDTIDGVQTSVTPTLSTTNKVQGNYSVAATCTVPGWWLNLRVAEPSVTLAELQATYSTITFHVYSNYAGEVIGSDQNTLWLYNITTGSWGKNLAIFTNGTLHSVTINTSDLTSSMYVTDAWGSYVCLSVGGISTLYIDNVQGVLK